MDTDKVPITICCAICGDRSDLDLSELVASVEITLFVEAHGGHPDARLGLELRLPREGQDFKVSFPTERA